MARFVRAACLAALFSVTAFLAPARVAAHDFGAILDQNLAITDSGGESNVEYDIALIPRFSMLIGESADLFLSASLKAISADGEWTFVPELLRNEFSVSLGYTDLSLGRMLFADPMNLVAAGLFDGVRVSRHTAFGTIGAGLWYTGLLYRNRANIVMTEADSLALARPFAWDDFADTYFASRRLMMALYWEHPSLAELVWLDLALMGQVDLNGRSGFLHSQYLIAKASMPFRSFIFELGGAMATMQSGDGDETDFYLALAGDLAVHWVPPAPFFSLLSFTGRFTSGRAEDGPMSVFTPVTALTHGNVLEAEIPGLSVLGLSYTARLHRTLSAGLSLAHFVRSDRGTYSGFPLDGPSDNYFLGTELFGRVIWSPVSDIGFSLGAGVFLPSLGDVAPNADPLWRVQFSLTLALY